MATADPELTVYSDYVCPFCYLGRRSLEQYEAERGEPLDLDWHPFDLRSHKRGPDDEIDHEVDDGKDEDYYAQAKQNVRRLKERYDVEMDVDVSREIDSLPAQLVSLRIKETAPDAWRDFDEGVFEAHWVEGRRIDEPDTLRELAADAGLDPDVVDEALEDVELRDRLFEQFEEARRHGVTGVPTFAYDGYAARGAVPPDQLRRLVEGT